MLAQVRRDWAGRRDLWVFGYASLIWNPEFEYAERVRVRVHGWHRALRMWSRINRGTPERPGLVFALLAGGCCDGVMFRIPRAQADAALERLWAREMPTGVYDPRWVDGLGARGRRIRGLAFTLSRRSPSFTGDLSASQLRAIFAASRGRYGTTLDYARQTLDSLRAEGIEDRALAGLLRHAPE